MKGFSFRFNFFLKWLHTRQFCEFSFIVVLFTKLAYHFFESLPRFLYRYLHSTNCTCDTRSVDHSNIQRMIFVSLLWLLFYYIIHQWQISYNNWLKPIKPILPYVAIVAVALAAAAVVAKITTYNNNSVQTTILIQEATTTTSIWMMTWWHNKAIIHTGIMTMTNINNWSIVTTAAATTTTNYIIAATTTLYKQQQ